MANGILATPNFSAFAIISRSRTKPARAIGSSGTATAWTAPPAAKAGSCTGYSHEICRTPVRVAFRSEEHTSELQSLMRISYAVFCLKKKKQECQQPNRHQERTYN